MKTEELSIAVTIVTLLIIGLMVAIITLLKVVADKNASISRMNKRIVELETK